MTQDVVDPPWVPFSPDMDGEKVSGDVLKAEYQVVGWVVETRLVGVEADRPPGPSEIRFRGTYHAE